MSFEYVAYDSRRIVDVKHTSQMTSLGLPQRPHCDQNVANAFITNFTPRRSYALVTGLQRGPQGYGGRGGGGTPIINTVFKPLAEQAVYLV